MNSDNHLPPRVKGMSACLAFDFTTTDLKNQKQLSVAKKTTKGTKDLASASSSFKGFLGTPVQSLAHQTASKNGSF